MALRYSLARVTGSSGATLFPAVNLTTACDHCRVPSTDSAQLLILDGLVRAAQEVVEDRAGISLTSQEWRLRLPAIRERIALPRPPLVSVEAVKYIDASGVEQTLAASTYEVFADNVPGVITRAAGKVWPDVHTDTYLPVTIEYTAGYASEAAVPAKAKQAILLLVSHWFENRTAVVPGSMAELPLAFESLVKSLDVGTGWIL